MYFYPTIRLSYQHECLDDASEVWLRVDQVGDSRLKQLQVASQQLQRGHLPCLALTAKETGERGGEGVKPLLHDGPQPSSLSLLLL